MITKIKEKIKSIYYSWFGFRHHIIKTSLPPCVWYDTDTRILYAVMDTVKWYVENDMDNVMTGEELETEIERIKSEHTGDMQDLLITEINRQRENDLEVLKIYKWWEDYPNREDALDSENNFKKYDLIHDVLRAEEQEMLKKAIELRFNMWS